MKNNMSFKILNRFNIENKVIILNIMGSFGVKGIALILSLFTMPAYIAYFENQAVLGIWYTLLSVLNWVLMFDLGLGNGLRNKLPQCLAEKNYSKAKEYIASTYITTFFVIIVWSIIGNKLINIINWNSILNIETHMISSDTLISCIKIVFCGIMVQFVLKLITSILYAIQKSAIVNLLTLLSTIIILISISIAPIGTIEQNLLRMSWINAIAVNLPLVIATIIIFCTTLKKVIPRFKNFKINCAKEVLHIGITLLWLQLIFMIISNTNEFLISHLTNPQSVVQYQAYNKVFNTVSSILTLGLAPIWSAVTRASSEGKYQWISKLYNILLRITIAVFICELLVVPFMQPLVDIWLGNKIVKVNVVYAVLFSVFSAILFLHNVNTSFSNGMSLFKVQIIWMTFAAIVNIPLAYIFVYITNGWIGVIIANIISLLPYEIIQIKHFLKFIKNKIKNNQE